MPAKKQIREVLDTRTHQAVVVPDPLPKKRGYLQVLVNVLMPGDAKSSWQWSYIPKAKSTGRSRKRG